MFQAHSEQERYSFCPHVAYIQNRKDSILKRMIDRVCLTDTVLGEAKISLGCHSQGLNILGTWPPSLSKVSHIPVVTLRQKSPDPRDHMG